MKKMHGDIYECSLYVESNKHSGLVELSKFVIAFNMTEARKKFREYHKLNNNETIDCTKESWKRKDILF